MNINARDSENHDAHMKAKIEFDQDAELFGERSWD